jgi:hypothetical protein
MNRTENRDPRGRPLSTADLAAAGRRPPEQFDSPDTGEGQMKTKRMDAPMTRERESEASHAGERLEALFPPEMAERYRSRWAAVQSSFVDDPRGAAKQGDELVAEVLKSLAESFAREREQLDRHLSESGEAATETLRVGLRRYRSFFDRLLSL